MSETETFQIQGLNFEISPKFAEGHTLAANEASALNQLLKENVRNNLSSKVASTVEEAGGIENLTDEIRSSLQDMVTSYAAEYEFGVRRGGGGGGAPKDPVHARALKLAKERVRAAIKAKGWKVSDVEASEITRLASAAIEKDPQYIAVAKAQLEEEAAIAQSDLLAGEDISFKENSGDEEE